MSENPPLPSKKPDWDHVQWHLREEAPPESGGWEAASYGALVVLGAIVFAAAAVLGPYIIAYRAADSGTRHRHPDQQTKAVEWVAEWDSGRFMAIRGICGAALGAGLAAAAIYVARKNKV